MMLDTRNLSSLLLSAILRKQMTYYGQFVERNHAFSTWSWHLINYHCNSSNSISKWIYSQNTESCQRIMPKSCQITDNNFIGVSRMLIFLCQMCLWEEQLNIMKLFFLLISEMLLHCVLVMYLAKLVFINLKMEMSFWEIGKNQMSNSTL